MFVSWVRYKKLLDLRNSEFMSFSREIYELKSQLYDDKQDTDKYKKLYADELQKRLELAEIVQKFESTKGE